MLPYETIPAAANVASTRAVVLVVDRPSQYVFMHVQITPGVGVNAFAPMYHLQRAY